MSNICRGKALFLKHNGKVINYDNLTILAKRAINQYYVDENGIYFDNDQVFGYALIPIEDLIQAIGSADSNFSNFTEYHDWYILGGDTLSYTEVWPLILDADTDDVIWDGWHRFHTYVESNIKVIPCVLPMFSYT